jgi:hypothetical protein
MTNITDIRNQLIEVFDGLRNGTIKVADAVEINNTAGKIINTAKVQIAYSALRSEAPYIPFLDTTGVNPKILSAVKPKAIPQTGPAAQ